MSNWNDLRLFLAVVRHGSLTAASRSVGVNQSTVGRRIDALESALGVRLFDRGSEGLVLTDAGRRCLAPAEAMETSALELERSMTGEDGRLEGMVRVATTESLAAFLVGPVVGEFLARHPDISLEVIVSSQSVSLTRREADVAIRPVKPSQRGLVAKQLLDFAWGLYASPAYLGRAGPVEEGALSEHDIIGFDEALAHVGPARWMARHARDGRAVLRTNSVIAMIEACAAGSGVAVLPCFFAEERQDLRRLPPRDVMRHPMYLVVHPDVRNTARVRAFIDFMTEVTARKAIAFRGFA